MHLRSKTNRWLTNSRSAFLVVLAMSLLALPVSAQNPGEAFGNQLESAGDINVFPDFSLGGFGGDTEEPIELSAKYFADASGDGRVEIQASVASFWHIYSTTQKSGGPTPTSLKITSPETVKLTGAFQPDHQPAKSISSDFDGMTIEEFGGVVTWSAPVSMPAGFEAVSYTHLTLPTKA